MDPLAKVFAHLDRWRHFPAYQLERRADIFFAVFLPEVLAAHTGKAIDPRVIPEFPIKRDLIWPDLTTSKSVKVDYVLVAQDRSRVYFVELKTDAGSRRDAQDEYLTRAKELGFTALLEGLVQIVHHTSAYRKYYHLLWALQDLGFLRLPAELGEHLYPETRPNITALLGDITISPVEADIEVIYLQPNATDRDATISFEFFAERLAERTDALSQVFAEHLVKWQLPAGDRPPCTFIVDPLS